MASTSWSTAFESPHSGVLNAGGHADLTSVTCASAGNCTVVGYYLDAHTHFQTLVDTEIDGTWSNAMELPHSGLLNVGGNAQLTSVSCTAPGNCTVAGHYTDAHLHRQALVDSEINGVWLNAMELPHSGILNAGGFASLTAVACVSPGNCTVAGAYHDAMNRSQALVASEINGVWSNAMELPHSGLLNVEGRAWLSAISCATVGDCTVVGHYHDGQSHFQALVDTEINGAWSNAMELPNSGTLNTGGYAFLNTVACSSPNNCTVGGFYQDSKKHTQALAATEVNNVWSKAIELSNSNVLNQGGDAHLSSVYCVSEGNCTVVGDYDDANAHHQALVASETNGVWSNAVELPGSDVLNAGGHAQLNAIFCVAANNCTVAGNYQDANGHTQAMVATETNGVWSNPVELPGSDALNASGHAQLNAIFCVAANKCTVAGSYQDANGHTQAMLATAPNVLPSNLSWSNAFELPGSDALNLGGNAYLYVVSCVGVGDCTAVGEYQDAHSTYQAMVATEINGMWSRAMELPGSGALNAGGGAGLSSISCTSVGNCTVVGDYYDSEYSRQAMVATETNGMWSNAMELPGSGTLNAGGGAGLTSVSCTSAGNCTGAGYFTDAHNHAQAMIATETNGAWANAVELLGSDALNAGGAAVLNSISCNSAGDCTVAGYLTDGNGTQSLVANETNGVWSNAVELPGSVALNAGGGVDLYAVSCAASGDCTVVGNYKDAQGHFQALVATESNDVWSNAIELPGSNTLNVGPYATLNSVSCTSVGDCTVAGAYMDAHNHYQALVATETNGVWPNAIALPGSRALNVGGVGALTAVSCTSPGNCTVVGGYWDAHNHVQVMVDSQINGVWANAIEPPGSAALNAGGSALFNGVSCPAAGKCTVVGQYKDVKGHDQAMVDAAGTPDGPLSQTPTPTMTGTPQVGSTLLAQPGKWQPGVTFAYQWFRNGVAIPGATAASYTAVADDLNTSISVTVTGSLPGYNDASVTSRAENVDG